MGFSLQVHAAGCSAFLPRLPNVDVKTCGAARLTDSHMVSVRGRPLLLRDVPNTGVASKSDAPMRVLVIGGIHGDELSASTLALRWIPLAERATSVTWRFIPVLNPDGLLQTPPQRMNARGVDLNRNFPTPNWERDAKAYWEKKTGKDPRRWPGYKPLSEPESQFLVAQIKAFQPQVIVSIHAPYGLLDFDGPTKPPSKLGRLHLDPVGIYPGSLGNYGGTQKGIPVVTIELPNARSMPLDSEMDQMWQDLLKWLAARR